MIHLPGSAASRTAGSAGRPAGGPAARARGALYGLAIGDALGMPTQMMPRPDIAARWGPMLTGFEPAPPGHPIAAGQPAGTVTDDTEQAVLLGRLLVGRTPETYAPPRRVSSHPRHPHRRGLDTHRSSPHLKATC